MKVRKRRKKARKPATDVELVLDRRVPPVEKKGTATIRGVIKHPWGPVKEATIALGKTSMRSDKDGNYEFTELNAGSYNIIVRAPFPGYEAQPQSVEILDGENKVVDVYLDFSKTVVEGYVLDTEDKPIVGATISGLRCGKDMASTVTDEKGYFKFDDASPGNQFIRVNASGYMAATKDFRTDEGKPTGLQFHLNPATCNIHGKVTNTEGLSLQAVLELRSSAGIIIERATSDAETGHYEFAVLPETYGLLATHQEYEHEGWRGSVSEDAEVNFKLKLVPKEKQRDQSYSGDD